MSRIPALASQRIIDAALALGVFVFAFASYNATLVPSLSYINIDDAELATVPARDGLLHPAGYPLYSWAAKLFTLIPVGDIAHRLNLLSAVGAAGSAALLYGIIAVLTRRRTAALFGALLWVTSRTLWSQAVVVGVHDPNMLMLSLTLLLAVTWGRVKAEGSNARRADLILMLLCLVYGLSLGAHMSNLAFAPALAVYVLLVDWRIITRPRLVAMCGAVFALAIMQFLWLPLRADTATAPALFHPPVTWHALYDYTLNAFPEFRWAFLGTSVWDRIDLYARQTYDNIGALGIVLALAGAAELARLRPREFALFGIGYVIEVVFFLEYDVFNIDVFFLPAHFVLIVLAGVGAWRALEFAGSALRRVPAPGASAAIGVASIALFVPLLFAYHDSHAKNNEASDTLVNDFYEAAFRAIPQNSVLIGPRGLLGNDLFYFREVEHRRPDVVMPFLPHPGTGRAVDADAAFFSTWAEAPPGEGIFPPDTWFVPVLAAPSRELPGLGVQRPLVLYRLSRDPPASLVVNDPRPRRALGLSFLGAELIGVDLPQQKVGPGQTAHLSLYWVVSSPGDYTISTRLGQSRFSEIHPMGFGLFERYAAAFGAPAAGVTQVEDYDLVVPSSQREGRQPLTLTIERRAADGTHALQSVVLGEIVVAK